MGRVTSYFVPQYKLVLNIYDKSGWLLAVKISIYTFY